MKPENTEYLASGQWWEKSGNTSWAQCPSCDGWFHLSASMLTSGLDLHCPHCASGFSQTEAKKLMRAD